MSVAAGHTDRSGLGSVLRDLVKPGDENLREMNKKLQNMLEEQLTKNMHLHKASSLPVCPSVQAPTQLPSCHTGPRSSASLPHLPTPFSSHSFILIFPSSSQVTIVTLVHFSLFPCIHPLIHSYTQSPSSYIDPLYYLSICPVPIIICPLSFHPFPDLLLSFLKPTHQSHSLS